MSSPDYANRYSHIAISRSPEGVVTARMHNEGQSLRITPAVYDELREMFVAVSLDPLNKVLVLTGTGDFFIKDADFSGFGDLTSGIGWSLVASRGRRMVQSCIDCDLPIIAAVNGPAPIHSELALLADVVIAGDEVWFQDPHMAGGIAPGDGIHATWMEVLGVNRARTLLLLGGKLDARQAHEIGVVAELVATGAVLPRAEQIAAELAQKPAVTLRAARAALTYRLSRALAEGMAVGWPLEVQSGLAASIGR